MTVAQRPAWDGRTVVCIASGPSLTADDCALVREAGYRTVVTNTTFRIAPWADALFAFDARWWKVYHKEVHASFAGLKLSASQIAQNYGAQITFGASWFRGFRNSGACAVSLAICAGARRIVMLGFDAMADAGRKHWHGDHPEGLENATSMPMWPQQFDSLARFASERGVVAVNASRRTRLTCFPTLALEDAL